MEGLDHDPLSSTIQTIANEPCAGTARFGFTDSASNTPVSHSARIVSTCIASSIGPHVQVHCCVVIEEEEGLDVLCSVCQQRAPFTFAALKV